jgi:hypothetical protein
MPKQASHYLHMSATCIAYVWLSSCLNVLAKTPADSKPPQTEQMDEVKALFQGFISGVYHCEFGQIVTVKVHTDHPSYIAVTHRQRTQRLFPVLTSSGALRAESVAEPGVWLQLPSKGMLLDQQKGLRVADECHLRPMKP